MENGRRIFAWFGGYEAPLATETMDAADAEDLASAINEQPDWRAEIRDAFGGETVSE